MKLRSSVTLQKLPILSSTFNPETLEKNPHTMFTLLIITLECAVN
jgi:hypothetical protein